MKGKLSPHVTISGNLTEKPHVTASLSSQQSLSGALSCKTEIHGGLTLYDDYDGPYEATPKRDEDQILSTSGKKLSKNVTLNSIPYWKTSNPQGGRTVYIGVS